MKLGFLIREYHDLQTHLKRRSDFTGNLERIWVIISVGNDAIDVGFEGLGF